MPRLLNLSLPRNGSAVVHENELHLCSGASRHQLQRFPIYRRLRGVGRGEGEVEMGTPSKAEYDQRWHQRWQSGVQAGQVWDLGRVAPAFTDFFNSGVLPVAGKVAYTPGCGRGYEVWDFAQRGAHSVGLDLAPESIEEARLYQQQQQQSLSGPLQGTIQFVAGDYFTYRTDTPWVDIGYDYQFFCALHPTMRQDWARTWAKLIKPGGYLVTLEWPIRPDDKTGPPWPVSPQIYSDLLVPLGFKNTYFKEVPQHLYHAPQMPGAEVVTCWQKI